MWYVDDIKISHVDSKVVMQIIDLMKEAYSSGTVCSQLKIKGVKNATKEQIVQTLVSIYKIKERYGNMMILIL